MGEFVGTVVAKATRKIQQEVRIVAAINFILKLWLTLRKEKNGKQKIATQKTNPTPLRKHIISFHHSLFRY